MVILSRDLFTNVYFVDKYGSRVKAIREVLGLNQKQLANALGISPPAVSVIEGSVKGLSMAVFERLVVDLGANPYFILQGTEPILLFDGSQLISQLGRFLVRRVGDEENDLESTEDQSFDKLQGQHWPSIDAFGLKDHLKSIDIFGLKEAQKSKEVFGIAAKPFGHNAKTPEEEARKKKEADSIKHLRLEVKKIKESLKKAGILSEVEDEEGQEG